MRKFKPMAATLSCRQVSDVGLAKIREETDSESHTHIKNCLLYTSDAADER